MTQPVPPPGPSSWVPGADGSGFGLGHLPYGVVVIDGSPRPAVRIGHHALDLRSLHRAGLLPTSPQEDAWTDAADLTPFLAAGHEAWAATRAAVTRILGPDGPRAEVEQALHPLDGLPPMPLPFTVGDFVDFYSSLHHATNVGRLFRPDDDPLLPNWRHLPIGYHGRSGTVVPSRTAVHRPSGQQRPIGPDQLPPFGPKEQLDVEVEVGFVVGGPPTQLGERVSTAEADERIFGVMLVNDWSARDIQAWEYRPLGPFLGKSFATSIATWITPLAALAAARVPAPAQHPPVADHLRTAGLWGLDLTLELALAPSGGTGEQVIARTSFADMYWTMPQQLAHVTSNGATIRPGDLFASGTVSGAERGTEGSLLELTHGGVDAIAVAGVERTFLQDGDTATMRGWCTGISGDVLTLADVVGTVVPAPNR